MKTSFLSSTGEIEIIKSNYEKIENSKKLKTLTKTFDKKSKLMSMLKEQRFQKLKVLYNFVKIYSELLYGLFNEQ